MIQPDPVTVVKTSTLVNFLTELTSEDLAAAGSEDMVMLTKHETDLPDIVETYDTLADAQTAKTNWDD